MLRLKTFILFVLCTGAIVNGKTIPNLTHVTWEEGRFGYFVVPKDVVQAKLDEVQRSDSCHEEFLTIPTSPVMPELQSDQHVVAIVYGKLGAKSIEDSLPADVKSKYETTAGNVQFFIPFLTGSDPDAEPTYKLALGSYVSTENFIQPNVAIPTEKVDILEAGRNGLAVVDGNEILEIHWSGDDDCELPKEEVVDEFDEYINEFTLAFRNEPDYSFCDEPGAGDVKFCKERYETDCACQFWTHGKTKTCKAERFSVATITKKFKEISLLDGPQDALVTEMNEGVYGIGTKKPCNE